MEENKRRSSSAMQEHMQKYPESGMTQKAYCEAHGISPATFGYWLKKYRASQGSNTGSFVRVSPRNNEGILEIQYPNGVVVRLQSMMDSKYIRELIR